MYEIAIGFATGFVGGFANAFSGYVKKAKKESFDWKKALKTSIIGGITGGAVSIGYQIPPEQLAILSYIVADVVENFWKFVKR